MSADTPSIRKLQPEFVISPGTRVVVKVAKALPDGEEYKPPASVGVVLQSPPSNREPYVVRFADSNLPEERDRRAIHTFLVRLRLGEHNWTCVTQ